MPAPSPPILSPRPPAPSLSSPPPQQSNAMGTPLIITFYGLDLWSLLTSWGSGIPALLEAQQSPSLSLQGLSAPGMCASQLLALNTTALLNTSLTAQQLMPGLGYFATDVAQLLCEYLQNSNITVQVTDFCAGNRTAASFTVNRTLVNGPWPTLRVTIILLTADPDRCRSPTYPQLVPWHQPRYAPDFPAFESMSCPSACRLYSPTGPVRQLLANCRGALTTRDSLGFFTLYGMPFHRQTVSVSGPFPVTGTVFGSFFVPAILFGPMTGNDKDITFSTCFSGNADWDSYLELFQTDELFARSYCGGPDYGAGAFNNDSEDDGVFPVCPFGSRLSTFTRTLTSGLKYWLLAHVKVAELSLELSKPGQALQFLEPRIRIAEVKHVPGRVVAARVLCRASA
ncbi:hypothetical protein QJQ45_009773 [Haematococcus lacustris]|nr:hypothetical protein QJQ45_009773 [Haematococcus lacustris]